MNFLGFLPLILFLVFYKMHGLLAATTALVIVSLLSIVVVAVIKFVKREKIPATFLVSNLLAVIFGSITLITDDSAFIKMKPTIFYFLCSFVMFLGIISNKLSTRLFFSKFLELNDMQWKKFSLQWAVFLGIAGIANELTWRFCGEETWVHFKVIFMPLIMGFVVLLQAFFYRAQIAK